METPEFVECRWCGSLTSFTGTKECNRCWELNHRIKMDPDLAKEMLFAIYPHLLPRDHNEH